MTSQMNMQIDFPGIRVYLNENFLQGKVIRSPIVHTHPYYELVFVQDNSCPRFMVIPPLREHMAVDKRGNVDATVGSIMFSLHEQDVSDLFSVFQNIKDIVEILDDFQGISMVQTIQNLVSHATQGENEELTARMYLLFVLVAKRLQGVGKHVPKYQTLDEKRFCILEEYFQVNAMEANASKKELADLLGVGQRQLSRILEQVYHSHYKALVLKMRMQMASALLSEGDMTADEIASQVGYQSVRAFRLAYRNYYGVPFKRKKQDISAS